LALFFGVEFFGDARKSLLSADAALVALIVLYPVLYAVLTRELFVVDIVVALAVAGGALGVVSGSSPRAYKLKSNEQLAANSAASGLQQIAKLAEQVLALAAGCWDRQYIDCKLALLGVF
jgi:hypothetical protein